MKRYLKTFILLCFSMLCLSLFCTDVEAAGPKLNMKKATIYVGKTVKLKVKNTKKKIKWSSSKKSVATVSKKGVVKGKKAGTSTIKAKVENKTYKCKVTVKIDGNRIRKDIVNLLTNKGIYKIDDDGYAYYELESWWKNDYTVLDYYVDSGNIWLQTLDIDNWDFIAINIKNPIAKKCEFRYYDAEWDETVTGELIKKKYQKDSGISILLSNLDTYSNLVSTKGVIKPFAYLALSGFEDIMDKYKVNISREDMGFYE